MTQTRISNIISRKLTMPLCFFILLFYFLTPAHALEVTLSWNSSPGATGYNVYLKAECPTTESYPCGEPWATINVGDTTSFTIPLPEGEWRFALTAYNEYGESERSYEISTLDENYSDIHVLDGDLKGAKIIYDRNEADIPIFDPADAMPPLDIFWWNYTATSAGPPMNLPPHGVFSTPVKIFIPCPGYDDVTGLYVFFNNGINFTYGLDWLPACNPEGDVLYYGAGWMVRGSRINHNGGDPSTIEIQVYQFPGGAQALRWLSPLM